MHLLIPLLRDSLYSNKKLAPLREYSTNAQDAHVEAGYPNRPIQVTLPTQLEPELRIRDFGKGLSILEMSEIYFKYLESTKRDSNDFNGMLGLGSKSAFAYADLFVVTSFKGGKKRIVACPISGEPSLDYEGDTTEDSGVEICIPVKRQDIDAFVVNALNFYKYWKVRPILKGVTQTKMDEYFKPIDAKAIFFGDKWTIRPAGYGKDEAVCVMGNVPYPIDWDQVKSLLRGARAEKLKQIWSFLENNIVELRLSIGDVDFTPNREALQYTDHTLEGIAVVLCEIYDRIFDLITDKISKATNLWEAMIIYNQLFHDNRLGSNVEKDSLFSGDMTAIKNMLQNRLKWNGIVINNGQFEDLEHWDTNLGWLDSGADGWRHRRGAQDPVFFTYTRDDSNKKSVSCKRPRRWHNCTMQPSPTAVVVVHDLEKASCIGAAARYLLWEKLPKDIQVVYFLRLNNAKVRKDFFEKLNFDSVPVIYVSDIEDEVKAWTKKNRVAATSSTGSREPIMMPYVDMDDYKERRHYRSEVTWSRATVRVHDIPGGVFVIYDRGDIEMGNKKFSGGEVGCVFSAYFDYLKHTGKKFGKVYGIHRRTANAKWFQDELKSGHWIPLDKVVIRGMATVEKDNIKKVDAFFNQVADGNGGYIGAGTAKKLLPLLSKTSPVATYCELLSVDVTKLRSIRGVAKTFGIDGFTATKDEQEAWNFKTMAREIRSRYPLIFKMSNTSAIQNNGDEDYYKLSKNEMDAVVEYITAIDLLKPIVKS